MENLNERIDALLNLTEAVLLEKMKENPNFDSIRDMQQKIDIILEELENVN
jgi:hypothetical protein